MRLEIPCPACARGVLEFEDARQGTVMACTRCGERQRLTLHRIEPDYKNRRQFMDSAGTARYA